MTDSLRAAISVSHNDTNNAQFMASCIKNLFHTPFGAHNMSRKNTNLAISQKNIIYQFRASIDYQVQNGYLNNNFKISGFFILIFFGFFVYVFKLFQNLHCKKKK